MDCAVTYTFKYLSPFLIYLTCFPLCAVQLIYEYLSGQRNATILVPLNIVVPNKHNFLTYNQQEKKVLIFIVAPVEPNAEVVRDGGQERPI